MTTAMIPRHARPLRHPLRRAGGGFTLIELLITLAIGGILTAVALPSYRDFVAGQRIKTAAYDFTTVLFHARTEALKRNADVTLAAASGGWQNGWTLSAGSAVIARHEAFAGMSISAPATSLVYGGNGRLSGSAAAFSLSANAGPASAARCITVNLGGIPASRGGACS